MATFDFEVGKLYRSKRTTYKLEGQCWGERSQHPYLVFVSQNTQAERLVRADRLTTDKFALGLTPVEEPSS